MDEWVPASTDEYQRMGDRLRALQAMHDLCVWSLGQGFVDVLDAAYQRGCDDTAAHWARGVR